jgi:hypothetical protein
MVSAPANNNSYNTTNNAYNTNNNTIKKNNNFHYNNTKSASSTPVIAPVSSSNQLVGNIQNSIVSPTPASSDNTCGDSPCNSKESLADNTKKNKIFPCDTTTTTGNTNNNVQKSVGPKIVSNALNNEIEPPLRIDSPSQNKRVDRDTDKKNSVSNSNHSGTANSTVNSNHTSNSNIIANSTPIQTANPQSNQLGNYKVVKPNTVAHPINIISKSNDINKKDDNSETNTIDITNTDTNNSTTTTTLAPTTPEASTPTESTTQNSNSSESNMVTVNHQSTLEHNRIILERLHRLRRHATAEDVVNDPTNAAIANVLQGQAWASATGARSSAIDEALEDHERAKIITQAAQQQQALHYIQQQQQVQAQQRFSLLSRLAPNHSQHPLYHLAPAPSLLPAFTAGEYIVPPNGSDVIEINSSSSENESLSVSDDFLQQRRKITRKKQISVAGSALDLCQRSRNDSMSVNSGISASLESMAQKRKRNSTERLDSVSSSVGKIKKPRRQPSADGNINMNSGIQAHINNKESPPISLLNEHNFTTSTNASVGSNSNGSPKKKEFTIAGPLVRGVLAGDEHQIIKIISQDNRDLLDDQAIRIATSKILYLATMSKDNDGGSATSSVNNINLDATSTTSGGKKDGSSVCSTSTNIELNPKMQLKTNIQISLSEIETIAKNFVDERRQTAKSVVTQAVTCALAEMNDRHKRIMAKSRRTINQTSNKSAKSISTANAKIIEMETKMEEMKKEHTLALEKMEERRNTEIEALRNQQERFIKELHKKHQSQTSKLRAENEEEKEQHARALKTYLAASCDALSYLRKHS